MPIEDATFSLPLTIGNARPYFPRTRLRVSRNTMPPMSSTRYSCHWSSKSPVHGGECHDQSRDGGEQAGEREDQDDVPVVRDAVRGDVRAEAQEEDLAERDLPGVAHHHVEPQHGDGEDADARDRLVGELRQP